MSLHERAADLYAATGGSGQCGCMPDPSCHLLAALVRWVRPDVVIQTGHLWGKSALALLDALTALDRPLVAGERRPDGYFAASVDAHTPSVPPHPRLVSIDPSPCDVPDWEAGIARLQTWYGDAFQFCHERADEWFARTHHVPGRLIGIVDGDHNPGACRADIDGLARLGARLIVVDDTTWLPDLAAVARDAAAAWGYHVWHLPQYQGVMLLVSARYTDPEGGTACTFTPAS